MDGGEGIGRGLASCAMGRRTLVCSVWLFAAQRCGLLSSLRFCECTNVQCDPQCEFARPVLPLTPRTLVPFTCASYQAWDT